MTFIRKFFTAMLAFFTSLNPFRQAAPVVESIPAAPKKKVRRGFTRRDEMVAMLRMPDGGGRHYGSKRRKGPRTRGKLTRRAS